MFVYITENASLANVEETRRFNLEERHDRMDTFVLEEAEGTRSAASINHAPCTLSSETFC